MDPTDPRRSLSLDAELLGHDPELANTVESLRRPRRGEEPDTEGRQEAPPSEAPVSPRLPPPVVAPVLTRNVPSGFLTRALPVRYGLLLRSLPWRAVGALVLTCVLGASAVAWGMVFLLRPSAFSRSAHSPVTKPLEIATRAVGAAVSSGLGASPVAGVPPWVEPAAASLGALPARASSLSPSSTPSRASSEEASRGPITVSPVVARRSDPAASGVSTHGEAQVRAGPHALASPAARHGTEWEAGAGRAVASHAATTRGVASSSVAKFPDRGNELTASTAPVTDPGRASGSVASAGPLASAAPRRAWFE